MYRASVYTARHLGPRTTLKDMRTTTVTMHRQSKDGKGKRREEKVEQNERSNKLDQVMGGRLVGLVCTLKTLSMRSLLNRLMGSSLTMLPTNIPSNQAYTYPISITLRKIEESFMRAR